MEEEKEEQQILFYWQNGRLKQSQLAASQYQPLNNNCVTQQDGFKIYHQIDIDDEFVFGQIYNKDNIPKLQDDDDELTPEIHYEQVVMLKHLFNYLHLYDLSQSFAFDSFINRSNYIYSCIQCRNWLPHFSVINEKNPLQFENFNFEFYLKSLFCDTFKLTAWQKYFQQNYVTETKQQLQQEISTEKNYQQLIQTYTNKILAATTKKKGLLIVSEEKKKEDKQQQSLDVFINKEQKKQLPDIMNFLNNKNDQEQFPLEQDPLIEQCLSPLPYLTPCIIPKLQENWSIIPTIVQDISNDYVREGLLQGYTKQSKISQGSFYWQLQEMPFFDTLYKKDPKRDSMFASHFVPYPRCAFVYGPANQGKTQCINQTIFDRPAYKVLQTDGFKYNQYVGQQLAEKDDITMEGYDSFRDNNTTKIIDGIKSNLSANLQNNESFDIKHGSIKSFINTVIELSNCDILQVLQKALKDLAEKHLQDDQPKVVGGQQAIFAAMRRMLYYNTGVDNQGVQQNNSVSGMNEYTKTIANNIKRQVHLNLKYAVNKQDYLLDQKYFSLRNNVLKSSFNSSKNNQQLDTNQAIQMITKGVTDKNDPNLVEFWNRWVARSFGQGLRKQKDLLIVHLARQVHCKKIQEFIFPLDHFYRFILSVNKKNNYLTSKQYSYIIRVSILIEQLRMISLLTNMYLTMGFQNAYDKQDQICVPLILKSDNKPACYNCYDQDRGQQWRKTLSYLEWAAFILNSSIKECLKDKGQKLPTFIHQCLCLFFFEQLYYVDSSLKLKQSLVNNNINISVILKDTIIEPQNQQTNYELIEKLVIPELIMQNKDNQGLNTQHQNCDYSCCFRMLNQNTIDQTVGVFDWLGWVVGLVNHIKPNKQTNQQGLLCDQFDINH